MQTTIPSKGNGGRPRSSRGPRAVLLGGSGFIGRWLTKALLDKGWAALVIDSRKPDDERAE